MMDANQLLIRFALQRSMNEYRTQAEGRPIYDEEEIVFIRVKGSKDEVSHLVTDEIRREYKDLYDRWKTNQAAPLTGTPLDEWPKASVSFIDEMRLYGVRTVEELAGLNDGQVSQNPGWMTFRSQAQAWLEAAADSAAVTRLAAQNEALLQRIAALEAAKHAPSENDDSVVRRGPGRPAKTEAA
jgi:hypothetical protein